jgi:hypothetical protein
MTYTVCEYSITAVYAVAAMGVFLHLLDLDEETLSPPPTKRTRLIKEDTETRYELERRRRIQHFQKSKHTKYISCPSNLHPLAPHYSTSSKFLITYYILLYTMQMIITPYVTVKRTKPQTRFAIMNCVL